MTDLIEDEIEGGSDMSWMLVEKEFEWKAFENKWKEQDDPKLIGSAGTARNQQIF